MTTIPLFAYERLATEHNCLIEELGYDPKNNTFVHQTEDRRFIIGYLDTETADVYYRPDDQPSFEADRHVVNLDNPDVDYAKWTPKVDWEQADCQGAGTGRWHSESGDTASARAAKQICYTCPISDKCLQWAIVTNEGNGIWGGLGEDERRGVRRAFVQDPDDLEALCQRIAASLVIGERPHILRYRNTPGVTHGKVSTWNRTCDHGPPERAKQGKSSACKACRAASMFAASRRKTRELGHVSI